MSVKSEVQPKAAPQPSLASMNNAWLNSFAAFHDRNCTSGSVMAPGSGHSFAQLPVLRRVLNLGSSETGRIEHTPGGETTTGTRVARPPGVPEQEQTRLFSSAEHEEEEPFAVEVGSSEGLGGGPEAEATPAPETSPGQTVPEPATSPEAQTAGLIVDDETAEIAPGQMRKSAFLDALRDSVCATADAELAAAGRTAQGCPYIARWIAYYRTRSSEHVERALHRYAPETGGAREAGEYIPLVSERVRRAVALWVTTGKIAGVPEEALRELPAAPEGTAAGSEGERARVTGEAGGRGRAGRLLFKARAGGPHEADPQSIQSELGSGKALDGGVRARMESTFGSDFSRVRVHTDSRAAELTSRLNARAFTVGSDLAFGVGEYQPGTLTGDALLAHELAHVIQQQGTTSSVAPISQRGSESEILEADADQSAIGAVASLCTGMKGVMRDIPRTAVPRLKSGLALQRCSKPSGATPLLRKRTVTGPTAMDCGGFSWGAQWYLDNADSTSGFVVQHVRVTLNVKDCSDNPVDVKARTGGVVDPAFWPLWEAWEVRNGSVFVGTSTTPHRADTYSVPAMGDGTKGSIEILGNADYYPGLTLPSSLTVRNAPPAGGLPVTNSDPGLSGGTGPLAHNLTANWTCCPGAPSKRTTLSTT